MFMCGSLAYAKPGTKAAAPALVALAPADDARKAIAIGPAGQVYEPDGKGAWIRKSAVTTADRIALVGRASGAVVALGEGVVYRLAPNGWSAFRLAQKGKAVMSGGSRTVAAVGRQVFALDRVAGGEPVKLALSPVPILAIGSGPKAIVIATEKGLMRSEGGPFTPIKAKKLPRRVDKLVSDRWALVDRGPVDLKTGLTIPWPAGVNVVIAAPGPDDGLVAVSSTRTGLELVTVKGKKITREPIAGTGSAAAVGVVVDKFGHAVIALRDGRLAVRDKGTWMVGSITEALPAPKPGVGPANSP